MAGFQYYVVENQDFMKILNSENKIATEFLLVELAQQYKNTITIENE